MSARQKNNPLRNLNDCGCCQGLTLQTPLKIANRPGLTAIEYRVGTHSQFRQSMLARLSSSEYPALESLRTRQDDDFSVALLDAWATAADVLTFYQERIANESYLRTALERRSLMELARLVGYELNPGVAASTFLAFTIEEAPGAPDQATQETIINIGTKVQSVPGPNEDPQTFETVEEIQARPEWNKIKPRLTRPQHLAINSNNEILLLGTNDSLEAEAEGVVEVSVSDLYIVGTDIPLKDEKILAYKIDQIYIKGTDNNLKAGEQLLIVGKKKDSDDAKTVVLKIQRVAMDANLNRTRIDFSEQPKKLPRFIQPVITKIADIPSSTITFSKNAVKSVILNQAWTEPDLNAFVTKNFWKDRQLIKHISAPPQPKLPSPDQGIFAFRQHLGFFGINSPQWKTLPTSQRFGEWIRDIDNDRDFKEGAYRKNWDEGAGRTIWQDSQGNEYSSAHVYLERNVSEVVENSWVVIINGSTTRAYRISSISDMALADYGFSSKVSGLTLTEADGQTKPNKIPDFKVRKTTAHIHSEQLELVDLPIVDNLEKGKIELMLDRQVVGLQVEQNVILSGERADALGVFDSELITLQNIIHNGGFTILRLESGLQQSYLRKTVTLNANVSRATHGETVSEVLGSGDAGQQYQKFLLRQSPLTFVSAPTSSGSTSTLSVRVNDLQWHEVSSFFGRDPDERVFTTRIDDDGKTTLQFGDGITGSRLPSGLENVRATYRKGMGLEGEVKSGQLTTLLTRPLGVKKVTNPLEASGAEDRESLSHARRNAPLTVLTLDRAVSLRDYEDFARAFAGVAKALAVWVWDNNERNIHITIAGPNGAEIKPESDTYSNLLNALKKSGDPNVGFRIKAYRKAFFRVIAGVKIHPDHPKKNVLESVEQSLREKYSFDERTFGQPVHLSEVTADIQSMPGIMAVDVKKLYRFENNASTSLNVRLEAGFPRTGGRGDVSAAELLTLDPGPIEMEVML